MRCPKCNQEINPHSERCTNCGTPAKYAVPDGDTLSRIRRHNAVITGENEVSEDVSDASFSPVLKFDRPTPREAHETITDNPADHFSDQSFEPVDLSGMVRSRDEISDTERRHMEISASIRRMIANKQDDMLAEYYFKDGITDLERYQLAQGYARLEEEEKENGAHGGENSGEGDADGQEQMSEAARRLSQFPEEKGLDKVLTTMWEKNDALILCVRSFVKKHVIDRASRLYDKFDSATAGFMNAVLDRTYYSRFGAMKRKKTAGNREEMLVLRRRIWCGLAVLLVLLVSAVVIVSVMRANDINGKWIISTDSSGKPNILMEFKPGGSAVISVRSEDGWHVHKKGVYTTKRSNGHDLLTIQYDDGDVTRLYYVVEGKTGTFTNVDTNTKVVYQLK